MRFALHAAAFGVGSGVGVAGVAVHRVSWSGVPAGIVLVLGTTFLVVRSLRVIAEPTRLPLGFALGWSVPVAAGVLGRAEGDYAVADDVVGHTLILAGVVLVVVTVAWAATDHDSGRGRGAT